VQKVEQIRQDLGKVGPVIAEQVVEALVGGTRKTLETTTAEHSAAPVRQLLTFERDLRKQIDKHYEQLQHSRDRLHLTPAYIQQVVQVGLQLAGQPPLEETTLEGVWTQPTSEYPLCPIFRLPHLRGSWSRCAEGLEHPYTKHIRPIVFAHDLAKGRDDVVLVHLNHRLVQMSLRLLRAEVWSSTTTRKLHRIAARVVPSTMTTKPLVVAHARMVMTGGNSHRLHEEVLIAGGEIERKRFRRLSGKRVSEALEAASHREPSATVCQDLLHLWGQLMPNVDQALQNEMQSREKRLQTDLHARMQKDIAEMTAVLEDLARTIRGELDAPQYQQLDLFSDAEREQYSRNVVALQTRLAQIPEEIVQETAAIRARYANPQARLFPVAITFLVPAHLA
jgi:hypothetical protein